MACVEVDAAVVPVTQGLYQEGSHSCPYAVTKKPNSIAMSARNLRDPEFFKQFIFITSIVLVILHQVSNVVHGADLT